MADLYLRTPLDAGAARISLMTPAGQTLTDLNTPSDDRMHVRDAAFGEYSAVVEPLGGDAQYYSFSFGPQSDVVELGGVSPSASQPLETGLKSDSYRNLAVSRSAEEPQMPAEAENVITASVAQNGEYSDPLFFLSREAAKKVGNTSLASVQSDSVGLQRDQEPSASTGNTKKMISGRGDGQGTSHANASPKTSSLSVGLSPRQQAIRSRRLETVSRGDLARCRSRRE